MGGRRVKYRALGSTGMRVSEIGLGAWQIGGPVRGFFEKLGWIAHGWGDVDDDVSVGMIHALEDVGGQLHRHGGRLRSRSQ